MSKYGSEVDSDGKEIRPDNSSPTIKAGERNPGYKFVSLELGKDKEGKIIPNRADFTWENSNGGKFFPSVWDWDGEEANRWQLDNLKANMLHVATKMMSKEEWYAAVKDKDNFADYIAAANEAFQQHSAGKTFSLKIRYNKDDKLSWPPFPNFIELDGTNPSTLRTDEKYDRYVKKNGSTTPPANNTSNGAAGVKDDLPF